jgi:hypothetical protein
MSEKMEFTKNYSDHSTNNGFQFEFFCDRCGSGFRTPFQSYALGTISQVLDAAGSIFGGVFGHAANLGDRARSVAWEKAHDDAFVHAAGELKPDFIQCPRCSAWVCRKSCWNSHKGLCKECSPDLGVEMAAAQSSRTVEEIWAHSKVDEDDREMLKEESWREGVRATCPGCNIPLAAGNIKFCPECGVKIQSESACSQCGAEILPSAKFCPECGAKVKK